MMMITLVHKCEQTSRTDDQEAGGAGESRVVIGRRDLVVAGVRHGRLADSQRVLVAVRRHRQPVVIARQLTAILVPDTRTHTHTHTHTHNLSLSRDHYISHES